VARIRVKVAAGDVREASQSPTVNIAPDPPAAGLRSRASTSTAAFRDG
jgi:hypothetical protein